VSGAGVVLDPLGIPIAAFFGSWQQTPAVASNGTDFLVVWEQRSAFCCDLYGARVSGAGTVLDSGLGIPISTATNRQAEPAVASWGANYFVVWEDRRSGTNYDIYGTGVGADGVVAQPAGIPLSTAAGDQRFPDLAVRYHFLVAWTDSRSGTSSDIYATRVSPSGVVEEPTGVLVAGTATPAVTGGPGATWGVVYYHFVPEAPYGSNRVFLRSVSPK
jgi:hypothetical protein